MFTDNEQNNNLYRGYNPAFVKSVLAKRVQQACSLAEVDTPENSMGGIAKAVAAMRRVDLAEMCGRSASGSAKSREPAHRARLEAIRLIKQKRPDLTSEQVARFFNRDASLIRTIWRRQRAASKQSCTDRET